MVRSFILALTLLAGAFAASPALAQFPNIFDTLFGDPPRRPPADVPSDQYGRPYPPGGGGGLPPGPPPRRDYGGLPPGPPPSRSAPYSGGPRGSIPQGGGVQTEPLPPPPGATSAPRGQPAYVRPPDAAATPANAPPGGLQPGQRPQRGTLPPSSTAPQPGDEVVVEPPAHKIANPTAVFSGLDKITGRIISFDVAVDETVRFGALEVTPRACYSRPATEAQATDGFIEVDELTLQGELKRIFSGWMFAASPGLNAVEHPIYDVWLTDCKGGSPPVVAEAPPAAPAPPQRAQQPRTQQQPQQRRATQQLPPPPAPLPR